MESSQSFAASPDEKAEILAGHVKHRRDKAGAVSGRLRRSRLHIGIESHQVQKRLKCVRRIVNCVGHRGGIARWALFLFVLVTLGFRGFVASRIFFQRTDEYPRRLRANPKQTAATFAKDLHLHLTAVQAELAQRPLDRFLGRFSACFHSVHFCH